MPRPPRRGRVGPDRGIHTGAEMFQHMGAGVRPRARAGSPATYLLSTGAHLTLVVLLLRATTRSPEELLRTAEHFTEIFLEAELAPEPAPAPAVAAGLESRAESAQAPEPVTLPEEVPVEIPPVSASLAPLPVAAADAAGSSGEGEGVEEPAAGEGSSLVLDSLEIAESIAPFAFEVTERVRLPRLRNRDFIMELLHRRFPPRIANRHATSEARVRFLIDARGKVVPHSIKLIATDQPEFAVATLAVAERLRFYPARHGRDAVPILIEMPFRWRAMR